VVEAGTEIVQFSPSEELQKTEAAMTGTCALQGG
jgi:hypothetical protein